MTLDHEQTRDCYVLILGFPIWASYFYKLFFLVVLYLLVLGLMLFSDLSHLPLESLLCSLVSSSTSSPSCIRISHTLLYDTQMSSELPHGLCHFRMI